MKKALLLIVLGFLSLFSQEVFPFDALDDDTEQIEVHYGGDEYIKSEI